MGGRGKEGRKKEKQELYGKSTDMTIVAFIEKLP